MVPLTRQRVLHKLNGREPTLEFSTRLINLYLFQPAQPILISPDNITRFFEAKKVKCLDKISQKHNVTFEYRSASLLFEYVHDKPDFYFILEKFLTPKKSDQYYLSLDNLIKIWPKGPLLDSESEDLLWPFYSGNLLNNLKNS